MTTPRQPAPAPPGGHAGSLGDVGTAPSGAVPAATLRGRLAGGAEYVFSDRSAGTMSASVGGGVGDDHLGNRARLAAALDLSPDEIGWMHQVHGGDVRHSSVPEDPPPRCDGILTTTPGMAVAVLIADCVPVLLAGPGGVAAAHAGRSGVVAGVAATTAARLAQASGCTPAQLHAVIGPSVGPCCYEVPADMAAEVERAVPGTRAVTTWGSPSIDLVAGVLVQLGEVGVRAVARAGGCTACGGRRRWFSHRATTGPEGRSAGRQAGVVVHPPAAVAP